MAEQPLWRCRRWQISGNVDGSGPFDIWTSGAMRSHVLGCPRRSDTCSLSSLHVRRLGTPLDGDGGAQICHGWPDLGECQSAAGNEGGGGGRRDAGGGGWGRRSTVEAPRSVRCWSDLGEQQPAAGKEGGGGRRRGCAGVGGGGWWRLQLDGVRVGDCGCRRRLAAGEEAAGGEAAAAMVTAEAVTVAAATDAPAGDKAAAGELWRWPGWLLWWQLARQRRGGGGRV
ncbi:hypothetical protein OsI_23581 [Oryza sativa Indica Group]|uniref:Uncharacterized protein n=1 Tax=Oryza sativa subsp. indica TaxID=39946 RepID=A2YEN5_ORYSI|nr:hypothetical protein OsI_23581 [Oryza sativa Indica Group]